MEPEPSRKKGVQMSLRWDEWRRHEYMLSCGHSFSPRLVAFWGFVVDAGG